MLRYLALLALFVFIYAPPSSASPLDDLFFEDGYQKGVSSFLLSVSSDVYIDCESYDSQCQKRRNFTLSEHGFENIVFHNVAEDIVEINQYIRNYKSGNHSLHPKSAISLSSLGQNIDSLVNYLINVQAFTATKQTNKGNILLIAFRGSQESEDWVMNLNGWSAEWTNYSPDEDKSIKVHQGFGDSFQKMFEDEINQSFSLYQMSLYDKIIITGHSLGGALATIMYAYLIDKGLEEKLLVYTFGAPAVGNKQFADKYDWKGNFYRVRNDRDFVPFSSYLAFIIEDNIDLDKEINQFMRFSNDIDTRKTEDLDKRQSKPQKLRDFLGKVKSRISKATTHINISVGALKAALGDYVYRHIGEMIVYHDGFRIPQDQYESRNFYELIDLFDFSQHSLSEYTTNIVCDFEDVDRGEMLAEYYETHYSEIDGNPTLSANIRNARVPWYKDAVVRMCGQRIIKGYHDGKFHPEKNINRAEFLKILLLSSPRHPNFDYEYLNYAKDNLFSDVSKNEWYSKYVGYAKDKKLIQGYSDATFKPREPITRAEAAKLLYDIFKDDLLPNSNQVTHYEFSDLDNSPANSWFYDAVYSLTEKSIIRGYPEKEGKEVTFRAGNYILRSEATVIVYRALCNSLYFSSCQIPNTTKEIFYRVNSNF